MEGQRRARRASVHGVAAVRGVPQLGAALRMEAVPMPGTDSGPRAVLAGELRVSHEGGDERAVCAATELRVALARSWRVALQRGVPALVQAEARAPTRSGGGVRQHRASAR